MRVKETAGSVGPGDYLLYQLDAERFGAVLALPDGAEVAALWLVGDSDTQQLRPTMRTRITAEWTAQALAAKH
jgi:hypothetical protein